MKHLLSKRLKGNTLIEVLVSLALLSMVFVSAMWLMGHMMGIHAPQEQYRTQQYVRDFLERPLPDPANGMQEEREVRGRLLRKEVVLLDQRRKLYAVSVSAYWKGRLLHQRKRYQQLRP